ncbi:hypothetical protein [Dactylosporangium sp. NPDC005555]
MTSAVDRYLDEMFDRLSGTGAAGRRLLAAAISITSARRLRRTAA